ncbi:MAG: IS66 family transposase [Balneolaceae bacterium]
MKTTKKANKKIDITKYSRSELENEFMKLSSQIEELSARIEWYEEQYRLGREKRFGASSEKTTLDQISLFNEPEAETVPFHVEPKIDDIIKAKKKKGHKAKILKDLPIEVIEYKLHEDEQVCSECNQDLHEMSKEIRKELKVIPAQVIVTEHIRYTYSCRNCEQNEINTPIIIAPMPVPVIKNSLASPTLIAHIMTRKYVEAVPLYRQEQQLQHDGLAISRQTMANWMIYSANNWLKPLYQRMHEHLIQKDVLHADETVLEVLCEPGRPATTDSYMWMYRTSKDTEPIILYDYQQGRSGEYPKAFLNNFKGYLHVDGYAGYHKVSEATLVGCWAHARRKYDEALKSLANNKSIAGTASEEGLNYCNKLFEIENELAELPFDKRYEKRLELSKPILESYFAWVIEQQKQALPQGYLGKAITYSLKQKDKLQAFLLDGRLEISNNRAERSIKPFVIGRKNWLFSNTPKGATASAIIYSIIETAKENGLTPFNYITYLLERLPNINLEDKDQLDALLPYSTSLPSSCRSLKNR